MTSLLTAAAAVTLIACDFAVGRLVTTEYGQLRGYQHTFNNRMAGTGYRLPAVDVFLGVPYATPPVGSNRFSPTRTPSPWQGVRSATQFRHVCPQKLPPADSAAALRAMPRAVYQRVQRVRSQLANQSEDCLYLNVYAPAHSELLSDRCTQSRPLELC